MYHWVITAVLKNVWLSFDFDEHHSVDEKGFIILALDFDLGFICCY
jgi:hypothetical protein